VDQDETLSCRGRRKRHRRRGFLEVKTLDCLAGTQDLVSQAGLRMEAEEGPAGPAGGANPNEGTSEDVQETVAQPPRK
jgi:hypothetical protein